MFGMNCFLKLLVFAFTLKYMGFEYDKEEGLTTGYIFIVLGLILLKIINYLLIGEN
jgi:hypothetical protein